MYVYIDIYIYIYGSFSFVAVRSFLHNRRVHQMALLGVECVLDVAVVYIKLLRAAWLRAQPMDWHLRRRQDLEAHVFAFIAELQSISASKLDVFSSSDLPLQVEKLCLS